MRTSTLVGLFLLPVVLFAAVPHVELPTNISPDPHGIAAPAEKPAAIYRLPVLKPSLVLMPEQLTVQAEDFIDWSVVSVGAPAAWAKGLTGKGVKVAVGDSGIDTGHKDFAGAIKASKDFTRNRNGVEDGNGHGCVMGSDMLYTTATGLSSAESVFAALIGPRIPDDIAVIKDVRHLEVYTLSANPKTGEPVRARVNAVHKLWHTGTMYKVKTGEGSLTLTPWHPIYVVTSTRGTERTIIKKRADEIQPGDNILLSGEIIEGDIKAKPRVSSAVVSIETFQHDDFVYDLTVEGTHVYACNGHIVSNTHCAGSIGARKNGWGVQGVAYECDLLVGKILSDGGSGRTDDISEFVTWAVSQGADVISLSIGGGGVDQWMPPVMAAAEQAGVLLICAAGNDGNGRPVNYPAAYKEAVAISAIDEQKRLAGFSCTGRQIACNGVCLGVGMSGGCSVLVRAGENVSISHGLSLDATHIYGRSSWCVEAHDEQAVRVATVLSEPGEAETLFSGDLLICPTGDCSEREQEVVNTRGDILPEMGEQGGGSITDSKPEEMVFAASVTVKQKDEDPAVEVRVDVAAP